MIGMILCGFCLGVIEIPAAIVLLTLYLWRRLRGKKTPKCPDQSKHA